MITLKKTFPQRDITKGNSIGSALEPIFPKMDSMTFEELKESFLIILKDEKIYASKETRSKWNSIANNCNNKRQLMTTLSNLYLGAAGLKLN